MPETASIAFYQNWLFWSVVASFTAIILSQLPPIHIIIRGAKIDLEVYSKIHLTHSIGNPNAQMHLIVLNSGGRQVSNS